MENKKWRTVLIVVSAGFFLLALSGIYLMYSSLSRWKEEAVIQNSKALKWEKVSKKTNKVLKKMRKELIRSDKYADRLSSRQEKLANEKAEAEDDKQKMSLLAIELKRQTLQLKEISELLLTCQEDTREALLEGQMRDDLASCSRVNKKIKKYNKGIN